jgi:hypothetical protein
MKLNLRNMLKITEKKHDLCETKMSENGYKDMNFYQGLIFDDR